MLIGIVSDTHGRMDPLAAAVRLLQSRGAEFMIHCGDVGSSALLDHFAGIPSAFVWGNCDWDRPLLIAAARELDIQCLGACGELTLDDKRIAVLHGDDPRKRKELLDSGQYDYLLHGHTHVPGHWRIGRTLLVNPGALHRATTKTAALLDTAADGVEFLPVI